MKILKFIIALLAIPLVIAFSRSFYFFINDIAFLSSRINFFIWGLIGYMVIHILCFKPMYLYILSHEVIHVLATWVCGGHITSFNVSSNGGNVTTSKTNSFIELSPYFVPLYSIFLIAIFPLARGLLSDLNITSLYIFVVGFTLGMHLIMTADSLKLRQPDLSRTGFIFSYMLIYISNLIIIALLISLVTDIEHFKIFILSSIRNTKNIYLLIWNKFV